MLSTCLCVLSLKITAEFIQVGFLHGDPHPGNLLKVTEGPHTGKLALLDFGLVAEIPLADRCWLCLH